MDRDSMVAGSISLKLKREAVSSKARRTRRCFSYSSGSTSLIPLGRERSVLLAFPLQGGELRQHGGQLQLGLGPLDQTEVVLRKD